MVIFNIPRSGGSFFNTLEFKVRVEGWSRGLKSGPTFFVHSYSLGLKVRVEVWCQGLKSGRDPHFWDPNFFRTLNFFESYFCFNRKLFGNLNYFSTPNFFGIQIFTDPKFLRTPIFFGLQVV